MQKIFLLSPNPPEGLSLDLWTLEGFISSSLLGFVRRSKSGEPWPFAVLPLVLLLWSGGICQPEILNPSRNIVGVRLDRLDR